MISTLDELDISQVRDLFGDPRDFASKEEFLEKIFQIFQLCGLDHGCLQTNKQKSAAVTELWRFDSSEVTAACQVLADVGRHPAISLAQNEQFPFDLFDFEGKFAEDSDIASLFSSFRNNDLKHVYCIPVHSRDEIFVFIIARPNETIDTVELLTFQSICANAINKIFDFEIRPCDAGKNPLLNKSERAALIGVARGETYSQIADSISFSEVTVKALIEGSMVKLGGRNVSHTVLLAIIGGEFGLIECIKGSEHVIPN